MGARNEQILFRFRAVFGGRDIFPLDGGLMALSDYQSRHNIKMLGGYQFIKGNIIIFRPPHGKKPIFKSGVNMKHHRELVFLNWHHDSPRNDIGVVIEQKDEEDWISTWVCLKIGYIPRKHCILIVEMRW